VVSGRTHAPATLPPGNSPRYPLDRRLGGPQNRYGRRGEEKTPLLHRDSNSDPSIVQPVVSRYTDWAMFSVLLAKVYHLISTTKCFKQSLSQLICYLIVFISCNIFLNVFLSRSLLQPHYRPSLSRQFITTEASVQCQVNPHELCAGHSGSGAGFNYHLVSATYYPSSGTGIMGSSGTADNYSNNIKFHTELSVKWLLSILRVSVFETSMGRPYNDKYKELNTDYFIGIFFWGYCITRSFVTCTLRQI
jgi:hypothetical protein